MKSNKYKILVLSDLKKSTSTVLKGTVCLAKMINGDIQFFHVRKPTDVVEKDNQLSAIRTINSEYLKTKKKIQSIIEPVSSEFGVEIPYSFTFGNIKDDIQSYIEVNKPDIIVLGKRKSKPFSIVGDNITEFILKTHGGTIMIAGSNNGLEPNKTPSLGILNNNGDVFNDEFANSLLLHTQTPLKLFKIVKNSNPIEVQSGLTNIETVEYVFEQGDNVINNISNYLTKSQVNLLCLDRRKKSKQKTLTNNYDVKDVISKLNVSLLLSGK